MSVKCPYLNTTSSLVFAAKFAAFLNFIDTSHQKLVQEMKQNITVPVSCSIEGTGTHVHHASTSNNNYIVLILPSVLQLFHGTNWTNRETS